jgi:competence protein ComEA
VPQLSRSQIAVYAALAVAVLLIGARAIKSGEGKATAAAAYSGGGSFSVSSAGGSDLVVHVAGAVASPGVYRLPAGSRVTDALQRAGGPGPLALVDSVNLAARLADGQQVVIPEAVSAGAAAGPAAAAMPDAPISLGTATVEQLDTIEGIGPVTAQDIVDYRDEHGGLASIEQLDEISGIGPATMEALRDGLQP